MHDEKNLSPLEVRVTKILHTKFGQDPCSGVAANRDGYDTQKDRHFRKYIYRFAITFPSHNFGDILRVTILIQKSTNRVLTNL